MALRNPILFFGLITTLLVFAPVSFAESGNYRIEVLVFRHLNNTSAPVEVGQLQSYFEFADLQAIQPAPAPIRLDVQSSHMEDIWRKLRLSSGFEPLVFAAWEQTRIDYHPPLRIHDEEVLIQAPYFPFEPEPDDPEFDESNELDEAGEPVVIFSDLVDVELPGPIEGAPPEDYIASFFRLDGTAQLTRSRFLHLKLDLEYREAMLATPLQIDTGAVMADSGSQEAEPAVGATPGPAMVFTLRQSRPVSTGDTQYFDSPYLGVIARVTATSGE